MSDCLSRKEKQREQQKAYILDVAMSLFSEQGYHEVSMQQIAAASEFSVGSLYNYFANKDALIEEIQHRTREQALEIILPVLQSEKSPEERIKDYIYTLPTFIKTHGHTIRLFMSLYGPKITPKTLPENMQAFRIMLQTELKQTIEQGIESGAFQSVSASIAALSLFVTVESTLFELVDGIRNETPETVAQQIEDLFLNHLLK